MTTGATAQIPLDALLAAQRELAPHIHRTPLLSSRTLDELTGFDVRIKAELLQRTGSYKVRGALNRIAHLTPEERARGVVCSSAGNHAQGVALAAALAGVRAVVVMAENATPSKVEATLGYGAEVVRHGRIWDEANARALELAEAEGLTMLHPFDDPHLIAGQGTLGLEILGDEPDVDVIVVPIGGGGLISGVASAAKQLKPEVRIVGVESSGAPAMSRSVAAGELVTLSEVDSVIDGLLVKTPGRLNLEIVRRLVDEIVTLPDTEIFDAVVWAMERCKLVPEAAGAAAIGALLGGLVKAPPGACVVAVMSGGNLDVEALRGRSWN